MDSILSIIQSGFMMIIPFIILLGILVFVHELGHFLVARLNGVKVEVFSLGFGKKIFQYQKGDTVYALSLIPLGGYVKMFGEQPGSDIPEDLKKVSFTHKNVWQRISIVLAGPLMNFIFAVFIFFIVAFIGEEMKAPIAGDVQVNSYAFNIGLRSGDRIESVNGAKVQTWDEIQNILNANKNSTVKLTVISSSNGNSVELTSNVISKENPNPLSTQKLIGEIEGLSTNSDASTIALLPDSPLLNVGLKTGDFIQSINGINTQKWRNFEATIKELPINQAIEIKLLRFSKESKKPEEISVQLAPNENPVSLTSWGIEKSSLYIANVMKDSPAEKAGVSANDKIHSISGVLISEWDQVITEVKKYDGKTPLAFEFYRGNEIKNFKIYPQITSITTSMGAEEKRFAIGVSPMLSYAPPETVKFHVKNISEGVIRSFKKTWDISVMTLMGFVRLFDGTVSHKNIGGVISIGQAAAETFSIGISQFLQMMAIVSVNLFILNLLPIPVLDGGHLVFYVLEVINRGPISLRKMEIAQQVGMVLLLSLMVFSLFNDFSRLLGI